MPLYTHDPKTNKCLTYKKIPIKCISPMRQRDVDWQCELVEKISRFEFFEEDEKES